MVATRSTDECSPSEISARLPMAIPMMNLAAASSALATTDTVVARFLMAAWWSAALVMAVI